MNYQRFSPRQLLTLMWWNDPRLRGRDAIICDGSIRSGKTVSMSVGFVLWSMTEFDGEVFAICGKTIESLRRNVITQLPNLLCGIFTVKEHRSENRVTISGGGHTNTYYLFGGKDEGSASLIQGITLSGVLMDEVALMPRSFVEQALARCSKAGSKFWFNCNPESPGHWFYRDWICKAQRHNALHLHFTMDDNYSLSQRIKERYERQYTGVFYRRFIQGEWCIAEGLVYEFDKDCHMVTADPPSDYGIWYISIDYGTQNPCSMGLWLVTGTKAVRVDEYYYSGRDEKLQKTDEEYYEALETLAGDRNIRRVVVDPSAASFITTIRRHGRFSVRKAKNDVLNGIRVVASMLMDGSIKIHARCKNTIGEFGMYAWDEKSAEDRPIKDHDHAMDDIRYFCNTVLRRIGRGQNDDEED